MKNYLILVMIPLFCSCLLQEENLVDVKTVVQVDSEIKINESKLKEELTERMSSYSYKIKSLDFNETTNHLSLISQVPLDNLKTYNSLFKSHTVGFWNTYLISDDIFNSFDMENLNIDGLSPYVLKNSKTAKLSLEEFSTSQSFSDEILGVFNTEKMFDSLKIRLKEYFYSIPSLDFYYLEIKSDDETNQYGVYMINNENSITPPLSNKHIIKAEKQENNNHPYPMIFCQLDESGSLIWEKMTEKASWENRKIAIIFDGKLVSCPAVHSKISGGKTIITGLQEDDDLDKITEILKMPKLSYQLTIVNQETIKN